jgi:hypothetical protein
MSPVPTKRIQIQAMREAWIGARKKILVDLLHGHLDSIWINSSELFNKDTLPETITLIGLSKGVWKDSPMEYVRSHRSVENAIGFSSSNWLRRMLDFVEQHDGFLIAQRVWQALGSPALACFSATERFLFPLYGLFSCQLAIIFRATYGDLSTALTP